ncbi:MAG TPA: transcription antitermination factor NusB [Candidatus Xenobia bacterium]|jgi:N utilization substance protein B
MQKRRAARILVLLALYQIEVGGATPAQALESVFSPTADEALTAFFAGSKKVPKATDIGSDEVLRAFVTATVEGTWKTRESLDEKLRERSQNWRPERMSRTDLNILRMALFELESGSGIPGAVTVNEAVELAKAFGEDESGGFVNGILGSMLEVNRHGDG